jgi:hypothetical protein
MRSIIGTAMVFTALVATAAGAQQQAGGDASRKVAGGGITAAGWEGKVDAREAQGGATVNDTKFAKEGSGLHITTGPATTYWNPANKASGDYTVMATFKEPEYMGLNSHPHPYGIVIGGNDLGTDNATYLYCAPYGSGTFIVRGMGPAPFMLNGRGAPSPAVHKAEKKGDPVTQDVALSVKGDKVSCSINGTEVWSAPKSEVVGAGKLKSTDGVYGIRMAHNTEAVVTNFMKM